MCDEGYYYSYVACYCDDLAVVHKDPDNVFDSIRGKSFTIKEKYATEYFLGGDFDCVKEPKSRSNILTSVSKTYAKLMMDNFNINFGFIPSKQHTDMPPNYKPDIDITDLYNDADKARYCQCIGDMQWDLSLGRINIMYATDVLSRFRPTPYKGHLAKIQNIYCYLNKYTSASIKLNTEMPIYDDFKNISKNLGNMYYGKPEELPHLCPNPMGNLVLISRFVHDKIMDDLTTGRSQTGIIHLHNNTHIEW